jgi:hypothetical protein
LNLKRQLSVLYNQHGLHINETLTQQLIPGTPEAAANAYSRFVINIADNNVAALRNTNNVVFASLDAFKTTVQHAKDTTKQIFDINTKAAQTFEQNGREVAAAAAQDANTRFNASINNNNTSGTTSTTLIKRNANIYKIVQWICQS